jgi:hypothetical protein
MKREIKWPSRPYDIVAVTAEQQAQDVLAPLYEKGNRAQRKYEYAPAARLQKEESQSAPLTK